MPRNKYPEETVEKILDVSLKLFLEKGYENTTVLDIVDHLGGLTRGAFYHHFKSTAVQKLVRTTLLPIDVNELRKQAAEAKVDKGQKYLNDYIVEPNVEELIAALLPQVVCQKLFTALVDSNASEHAARTMAMQIATDNADDLIQDLTVQYNKSRQQAITSELLDIVGGSMQ